MNFPVGILGTRVAAPVSPVFADRPAIDPVQRAVPLEPLHCMAKPDSDSPDRRDGSLCNPAEAECRKSADPLCLTMLEFLRAYFLPDMVSKLRNSGRWHYQAMLKHVISPTEVDRLFHAEHKKATLEDQQGWPYLNDVLLADVTEAVIRNLLECSIALGHSPQTTRHIRSVLRSVLDYALSLSSDGMKNPASKIILPRMGRNDVHTLTMDQLKGTLRIMSYPERQAALLMMLTGMSMCEVCGLRWKDVNLLQVRRYVDGLWIPPKGIAVRHQVYRCNFETVPQHKVRLAGISEVLLPVLMKLKESAAHADGNDFVLASRNGGPVNLDNLAARRLKAVGQALGIPWLNWQVFRRTVTTLNRQAGRNWRSELKSIGLY